jgi:hypothetical protein
MKQVRSPLCRPFGRPAMVVAAVAMALGLGGCPSFNMYGTARTVRPGRVQGGVAIEGLGATSFAAGPSAGGFVPTLPSAMLRVGVHDRVDLGFRLAGLSSLGFDTKVNFLRTPTFDMAVNPMLQGGYFGFVDGSSSGTASAGFGILYMHLPLVFGINASDVFSFMFNVGVSGIVAFGGASTSSGPSAVTSLSVGNGFLIRAGIGANIRPLRVFAIQPELTMAYSVTGQGLLFLPGVGFTFGGHPRGPEEEAMEGRSVQPVGQGFAAPPPPAQ